MPSDKCSHEQDHLKERHAVIPGDARDIGKAFARRHMEFGASGLLRSVGTRLESIVPALPDRAL